MLKHIAAYPVRMTAISWALALSAGYLIGKTLGAVTGSFMFHMPAASLWQAENIGIGIGLAIGSMVSGFLSTFILQSKFQVRKAHYLIGAIGWLAAMLIALLIMSLISQVFAD
jgi:membrane protein CcdC involved in cytochrome C biogenesis